LNLGVRPPATFIGWPVRGFLPLRALRRPTENVPKPTRVTGCPRLSDVRIDARSARSARSEAALVQPLSAAIDAMRSARVMREGMPWPYAAADASRAAARGQARPTRAAHPHSGARWYVWGAVKKVLLFTMEGNADGEAALAFFQSRGAAVDVRDVGRDPDASSEVFRLAGRLAVPTIVIDERVFLGFGGHRDEIEALVRE
jgi:hypothetical protein